MRKIILLLATISVLVGTSLSQTSSFTYQGKLTDAGNPPTAQYDLIFRLFDASGTQIGTDQFKDDVQVTIGIFTVTLDFGASPFTGITADSLEIAVRPGASTGTYTTLIPRQPMTSSPYAIKSTNATSAIVATDSTQLGGVAASQYVITSDSRMSDARTPLAGSADYIQNRTTQQALSNFNVSGDGTAGGSLVGSVVRANTQFNFGNDRIIGTPNGNLAVGVRAGLAGGAGGGNSFFGSRSGEFTTGASNSFFGNLAGFNNTVGSQNSFFGNGAGGQNIDGGSNSFFGSFAGSGNNGGDFNSFYGAGAGSTNNSGDDNSFFGYAAGSLNQTACCNSFFGKEAGESNQVGIENAFFGRRAGRNSLGSNNTFIGASVGAGNVGGNNDTLVGANANVLSQNLSFATAIGAASVVSTSNTIALGRSGGEDTVQIRGPLSLGRAFEIEGFGTPGGRFTVAENGNVTIGRDSVGGNLTVFGNTLLNTVTIANGATLNILGAAGAQSLCRNASAQISSCSSSLRYKQNINPFASGLSLINLLRPVTFNWKANNQPDMGLVAEEVAEVEPLLVTHNDKGEVEGVKYDRIGVVLINAVKEQQAQIERQQKLIEQQQQQIDALRKFVCEKNQNATICNKKED